MEGNKTEMVDVLTNETLFKDLKNLIDGSRLRVAAEVNFAMTSLYWEIGNHINLFVLNNARAGYGKATVKTLAQKLVEEYGNSSFSEKNLRKMMRFAEVFPDKQIVAPLVRQLSWSHFLAIMSIDEPLKRDFYIEMCKVEHWSKRTLKQKIDGMLYERTAISKRPEIVIEKELQEFKEEQKMKPDMVFRDPYILDFLGLHDSYSEKDVENAIIAELQKFICEIGTDFAFMARQKRITIDNEDYYMDLLFYHRRLKCLVVIELKLGDFKAAYKGQMELYLRWLEKYEKIDGENNPIGLILCTGKSDEHIELLHLDNGNIRVAEYMTTLPEEKALQEKLMRAISKAKEKLKS